MSDKVHYSDLGLVNTRDMFAKAMAGGYAIPAYNFNNLEQLQAIVTACVESRSPVIIQVSKGAREYANATMLRYMAMGAVKMANEMGVDLPVCLHLDHGDSFEGRSDHPPTRRTLARNTRVHSGKHTGRLLRWFDFRRRGDE